MSNVPSTKRNTDIRREGSVVVVRIEKGTSRYGRLDIQERRGMSSSWRRLCGRGKMKEEGKRRFQTHKGLRPKSRVRDHTWVSVLKLS